VNAYLTAASLSYPPAPHRFTNISRSSSISSTIMSESQILKADKDFSKEVDALLPLSEKLSHVSSSFVLWIHES
jgi:hypothetical protein